ncbi:hypothetical protein GOP47_0004019 [Adiantum capillus-veneris]|uniref:Uncharacterized protein n=1 Tax=Adiantum capillus-veneris TaxID=13818 RepID=A0A9D4V6Q8_ADICA|nr:hypothetical protein GOP47_0004019 [Adiantum capillus-veneris]
MALLFKVQLPFFRGDQACGAHGLDLFHVEMCTAPFHENCLQFICGKSSRSCYICEFKSYFCMEESQPSGSNGRIPQPEALKSPYKAAKAGDVKKIDNILASNADEKVEYLLLSYEDESSGELPLHVAAREGHQEALDLLLPQNLTNAQTSRDDLSALHFSAGCGQFKVVQWLVNSQKPDLNLQDKLLQGSIYV